MKRPYDVINSTATKIGRFMVVQDKFLIDGVEHPYSYIKEKDCSCVLPLYQNNVVVIKQYRHAINQWRLELPTGAIDDGETPEDAARRELLEETGYVAGELINLGECFIKPGTNTGKAYMYLAKCTEVRAPQRDASELIETQLYTLDEFKKLIETEQFGQTIGLICWYKAKKFIIHGEEI